MATSTEVIFHQFVSDTAKTVTVEVTSDFASVDDITWAASANRGLIKIVDPNGNTHYNNTTVASPDIVANTKTISNGVIASGVNHLTCTSHGFSTGQPITYAGSGVTGLTANTTYFAVVVDSNNISFATSYANAIAGTVISISGASSSCSATYNGTSIALPTDSDNEILQGNYTVTVTMFDVGATGTQFDRSQVINFIYDSPEVSFTNSYSVINPIFLKSIDSTNYTSDNVTPNMSGTMVLNYPDNLGTYIKTITGANTTLSTSGFYGGSPATHSVTLSNSLTYTFNTAYYSDATGVLVPYYVVDLITGRSEIEVYSNTSGCDIYCCLKKLEERVEAAKGTRNYVNLLEKMARATELAYLMQKAYDCNQSEDVVTWRKEFDRITGCTGDCSGCGDDVTQVVGIGTTPQVTKKEIVTLSSNVTSYTFSSLIGKSFTNGDFIPMVDGQDVEFVSGYNISFNSITGTITYGITVLLGSKIGWRLV